MNDLECGDRVLQGRVLNGQVVVEGPVPWPDGTDVSVRVDDRLPINTPGHVIVAGFGLPGRCVVELLQATGIKTTIVDKNPDTVATQRGLGYTIVAGDITDKTILLNARIQSATALTLTIPDEGAVLRAIALARELNPGIFIIARTNYSSKGLEAFQLGADEVIKAEQAVAREFRERIQARFRLP